MPLTFTSTIEDEVNAASLACVELFDVEFGFGRKAFWASAPWTTSIAKYEPRIISVGDKDWVLGPHTANMDLELDDADQFISDLWKQNPRLFQGAKIRNHLHFPAINETYNNFWVGYGQQLRRSEGSATWTVGFGLAQFNRNALRKIGFNCPLVFADRFCSYNLDEGRGLPNYGYVERNSDEVVVAYGSSGTATGGSNTTLIDAGANFVTQGVRVGWYVYNRTHNAIGRITSIATTTLTFTNYRTTTGIITGFVSGHSYLVGPAHTFCPKITTACQERGRFSWSKEQPLAQFPNGVGGDSRREYAGNSEAAKVQYSGRIPKGGQEKGKSDKFTRTSLGNESLDSSNIPVIYGFFRMYDVPALAWAPAGRFQYGYFKLCEAEVVDVAQPFVNQHGPDNTAPADLETEAEVARNDSFIKWGVWANGGNEDDRVTGVDDTIAMVRRVRNGVGRNRGVAVISGNKLITTQFSTPYLFTDADGTGISRGGTVDVFVRIDTDQDITEVLTLQIDVWGRVTFFPNNIDDNEDGAQYNKTSQSIVMKYTGLPSIIQAAYDFCVNGNFGLALPESALSNTNVKLWHDFCQEVIPGSQALNATYTGTVDFHRSSSGVSAGGNFSRNFIYTRSLGGVRDGELNGYRIIFTSPTRSFSATIMHNYNMEVTTLDDIVDRVHGVGKIPSGIDDTVGGMIIQIDKQFPVGIPLDGDSFTVYPTVRRFKAHGWLNENLNAGEMLQKMLENCHGSYIFTGEQLEFVILAGGQDFAAIEANGVFTDRGVNRNILRDENGKSSLVVYDVSEEDAPNEFAVEFFDQQRNYQRTRFVVYHESAQIRNATLHGEAGSRRISRKTVQLNLTTSRDQAVRLLALKAREEYEQNVWAEFDTSLKFGLKAKVGDVIALDSLAVDGTMLEKIFAKARPSQSGNIFFRIQSKSAVTNKRYSIHLKCKIHIDAIYTDTGIDYTEEHVPNERTRGQIAERVKIESLTEEVVYGGDGGVHDFIKVKITYPNLT